MPEATRDIHDSRELSSRVGALLDDMKAGTPRIVAQAPAGGDQDLAAAVQKLLDESKAKAAPAAAPGAQKIESVDAALAGRADDLIAGEFIDESAELRDDGGARPVAVAPAPPAATATETAVSPRPSRPAPAPAPIKPEHAPSEPRAAPASAPTAPPSGPGAAPMPVMEPAPVAPAPAATPARRTGGAANDGPTAAAPPRLILRSVAAISAPLNHRPHLRDMVGWIALVQAFMALCVWVYVLLIRSDTVQEPAPPTPSKETGGESGHTAKPEARGAEQARGSKAPTKTAAASTKKKPVKKGTQAAATGHH